LLSQIKGQPEAVAYLKKVVEGRLSSPLLLVGDEGVGRRFSVVQTVKEIFSGGDAKSHHCFQIDQGVHVDFTCVAPEAGKEIGVDTMRDVIRKAYDFPMISPKRFIVIDGADRMTSAAANAFLKTLEEPPKLTQFFLIAESAEAVLPTIRSRCGKVRYKRLSEAFIVEALQDFVPDAAKALVYARLAEGSIGRAFLFYGSNRLELRDRAFGLLKVGLGGDLSSLFLAVDALKDDLPLGIRFLELVLYDLAMLSQDPTRITNLDLIEELRVVGAQIGASRVRSLHQGLRVVQDRSQSTKINLAFHVKACLAAVFSE
jgi:DNA polymerase III subunit delta'